MDEEYGKDARQQRRWQGEPDTHGRRLGRGRGAPFRRLPERNSAPAGLTDAAQPVQPAGGPGGSSYYHEEVISRYCPEDGIEFLIFSPSRPVPETAPPILLLHGYGGGRSPGKFSGWVYHMVRRGNMVVLPLFFAQGLSLPPEEILPFLTRYMILALKRALRKIREMGGAQPDIERLAVVGISLGGMVAAHLAAAASDHDLPSPKAVMSVMPGYGKELAGKIPLAKLQAIDPATLMQIVVCEDDERVGDFAGKQLFLATPQVSSANKNLIVIHSDFHGNPPLVANHGSAAAACFSAPDREAGGLGEEGPGLGMRPGDMDRFQFRRPNSMHYYGYWKLFDGLRDAAFHGTNREYALGDTAEQRFMGVWSDGAPVRELSVITHLEPPPA